jgi:hypothetical protein
MNTHHVIITRIPSGETLSSDFPSQESAEAWRDNVASIQGLDFTGGHHYFPHGPGEDPVIDPNPNATCVISEIDNRPERIEALWNAANDFALSNVDRNEREQFLGWLITPGTSAEKMDKIAAVSAWLTAIWSDHYYPTKALIEAGNPDAKWDPSVIPPLPYTFFEIATTP